MYTIAIPGCWSASTGSTKSLAEREIKKANGTIHSPQRKKANICIITNISHFTFNKLLWRSYADHTYLLKWVPLNSKVLECQVVAH